MWSLAPSAGVLAGAPLAAALAQRLDRGRVMAGGFLVAGAGFAWLTQTRTDSPLWTVLAASAVYASALVSAMTLANELALAAAPPERAGSAAAVLKSGQELGGALGMALLGSIGAAVFTRELPSHETLGAALATGSPEVGRAAREAFTAGLTWAAAGAAAVMLLAATLSATLLRGTRPLTPQPRPTPVRG
ncbi:multidrug transporter [Streptomyces purpureus]|uniref:multidrug transporter n=1 Tax=Streptomyces purpureus TaxID=1951 RepID=UPI001FD2AECA|nr:multidrug transporter [Streptomyces purpureus]